MQKILAIKEANTHTRSAITKIKNNLSVLYIDVHSLAQLLVSLSGKATGSASVVTAVSTSRCVCGEVSGDSGISTEGVVWSAGMTVTNSPVDGFVNGRQSDDRFSRDHVSQHSFVY